MPLGRGASPNTIFHREGSPLYMNNYCVIFERREVKI